MTQENPDSPVSTARVTIAVDGLPKVRRMFAQANEVIDELRTQVDDLTDENNELRRRLAERPGMTDERLIAFIDWCRMNDHQVVHDLTIARRVFNAYDAFEPLPTDPPHWHPKVES